MMTLVGTDIEQISRIKRAMAKTPGFVKKVFTRSEQIYCDKQRCPAQHYTARFCAKEALVKALGVPLDFQEVEVEHTGAGKPILRVRGKAARMLGRRTAQLSLSHSGNYALAVVIV